MAWTSRADLFELLDRTLPHLTTYRAAVGRQRSTGTEADQRYIRALLSDLDMLLADIGQLSIPTPTGRPAGKHTPWSNRDRYSSDH